MGWHDKQQINPIQPSIAKVIDFLSYLFQAGLRYLTQNTYRSAISSYHTSSGGVLSKPGSSTHALNNPSTWDVGLVTMYLEGLPSANDLTVSVLTKKCAMLLALSDSKRESDY